MQYTTYFEANVHDKLADFALITFFWVALGFPGLIYGQITKWKKYSRKRAVFGFLFTTFLCSAFLSGYYSDYRRLEQLTKTSGIHVVEGVVKDFKAYPAILEKEQTNLTGGNDKKEHFCVNEICFEYVCCQLTPGFNQMSYSGSPIHDGLPIRVTYIDRTIIKLEIGQDVGQENKN